MSSPDPVQVGDVVYVDLWLSGVQDLYAFQLDVQFDGAVLQATSSTEGNLLGMGGETFGDPGTIDNPMGASTTRPMRWWAMCRASAAPCCT